MKLSEAIMLGSTLSKQGYGNDALMTKDRCALGSAKQALGWDEITDIVSVYTKFKEDYAFLGEIHENPDTHRRSDGLEIIWKLNDVSEWTREQIAEWVAKIE